LHGQSKTTALSLAIKNLETGFDFAMPGAESAKRGFSFSGLPWRARRKHGVVGLAVLDDFSGTTAPQLRYHHLLVPKKRTPSSRNHLCACEEFSGSSF
jgi:hypothetical protein